MPRPTKQPPAAADTGTPTPAAEPTGNEWTPEDAALPADDGELEPSDPPVEDDEGVVYVEDVVARLADNEQRIAALAEGQAEIHGALERIAGLLVAQEQAKVEARAEAAAAAAEDHGIQFTELPEGVTRFYSPIRNYRIARVPGWQENVQGRIINHPQLWVDFNNGIADCNEEETAFLLDRPELGHDFWPDPTAVPQTGPVIRDGFQTAEKSPRAVQQRQAPLVRALG